LRCFNCNKEIAKHKRFCTSCDVAAGLESAKQVGIERRPSGTLGPSHAVEHKRTVPEAHVPMKRKSGAHAAVSAEAARKTAFRPLDMDADSTHGASRTKLVGWMVSFTKDSAGHDIQLREGRSIIGSDAHADIYIHNDRSISANHAIIMCRDGVVFLRDNDSMNGTYVDDADIFGKGSVELKDRSRVRFGDSQFTIYLM
jgi:hypothetical protein